MTEILLGQVLTYSADPFQAGPEAGRIAHGAVAIDGGRIAGLGNEAEMRAAHPEARVTDHGADLISPGFIDAHVHYPQTAMIASWGKRLIDWLNLYTFPEEMRFADPAYAALIAARYFDLTLANGTTTVCSYATIHPESVDAFFAEAERRGLRALAGKTCMDRNAPSGLLDTPELAYDQSKALLRKWHGRGRLGYVITPRFSPTSTPEQLAALGALWKEHPDCLMQTHLSEQTDEIDWVKALHPQSRDYLDTYETQGLLAEGAVYGHAIWLTERERSRLREAGASLVHCPTSNTFIGSGLFDMAGLKAEGQRIGLATDTGGGSSFSMLRTMAAAYEVAQLRGTALHPSQLWWLATRGSAEALHLEGKVGSIAAGMEADLVVIDLASTPAIAQRAARSGDTRSGATGTGKTGMGETGTGEMEEAWAAVFPTIMMGDDRAIRAVYVEGRRVVG